jgi:hypothetical protein
MASDRNECACSRRLQLRLEHTELDDLGEIRWTFRLRDDRLRNGETYVHAATPRTGHPLHTITHTETNGLGWTDLPHMDGIGLPLADPDLLRRLEDAIEDQLRTIDLVRWLLAA